MSTVKSQFFALLIIILTVSCNTRFELIREDSFGHISDDVQTAEQTKSRNTHELYMPDSSMLYKNRMRQLKVNVLFMDAIGGGQNLQGDEARQFANELIDQANYRLSRNVKMNLPIGNTTAVYPINFRLLPYPNKEDYIRFEYDDELYYVVKGKNQYDRTVINKYAKDIETVLNIFVMPHQPDSLKSETYGTLGIGIALGNAIKIHQDFVNDPQAWKSGGTVVHEIGHVLGLRHTWRGNDRCDDTPHHANCWGPTDAHPCNRGWSNNLMDYNQDKKAVTPCQLGIINQSFNKEGSKIRKLLIKDWCEKKIHDYIMIDKNTLWECDMDISSDVIVTSNRVLEINSTIRMATGASIIVENNAKVILGSKSKIYNDCSKEWGGFITQHPSKAQILSEEGSRLENYPKKSE